MVVGHKVDGIEGKLMIDYSKHFDKTWLEDYVLRDLLNSDYMSNLALYIHESYLGCVSTYPRQSSDIFKAFKLTPLTNVRVVLIGDEPFTNVYSNGLAFGQKRSGTALIPREAIALRKAVEKTYFDRENVVFDTTLEDWARQGVLLLNTSLISELASPNKHRKVFRNFIRQVIKVIDDNLADVVFVFTNRKQEEMFGKYIHQDYNHIITVDGITENTDLFDEINGLIVESEGSDVAISWL